MNPFDIPMAGASWIEIALALGASAVLLIYIYQVFFPKLQGLFNLGPDPEARAAELLDQYKQQRAAERQAAERREKQRRQQSAREEA